MSGGLTHGEVCSSTRNLEKSPSKSQGSSTLGSARGDLSHGRTMAKSGGHAAGKKVKGKLSKAQKM